MFQGNRISRARQQTHGTAKPNISSRALCLYEVGFHYVLECAPRCVGFEAYLPPTSVFSVPFYPTYGTDSPSCPSLNPVNPDSDGYGNRQSAIGNRCRGFLKNPQQSAQTPRPPVRSSAIHRTFPPPANPKIP